MSLLQKASIITTPTAYAEDFLYNIKPAGGLGDELVTNGDFSQSGTPDSSSYTLGWYSNTGGVSISNGSLTLINNSGQTDIRVYATNGVSSNNILTTNIRYELKFDIIANNGSTDFEYYSAAGAFIDVPSVNVGSYTINIKNTSNQLFLFRNKTPDSSITIDNVSIKQILDFDFDRNSTGTRVNEDYLIEDVPYNLTTYSEDFSQWTLNGDSVVLQNETYLGRPIYKLTDASGVLGIYNDNTGNIVGQTYIISLIAKKDTSNIITLRYGSSNNKNVQFNLDTGVITSEASGVTGAIQNLGNGFYQISSTIASLIHSTISYAIYTDNGSVLITSAQIVKGDQPKDYLKTTDRLDIPRIDYTNGEPSILLEPSRTNLYTYSSAFTNITDSALTVTDNSTTSPENLTNATSVVPSTANTTHYLTFPNTSTGTVTFSVYAKSNAYNFIFLHLFDGSNGRAWFNLETGKVGTKDSSVTSQMVAMPNGWYRCSVTRVLSGSLTQADIAVSNADNTATFAGDGTSGVFVYGAQLEAGSYATSLIHTSGSTVTRSADAADNAGNSDLISSTEGVLYAEIAALANDGTYREISLNDGTGNDIIEIRFTNVDNQMQFIVRDGGSVEVNEYVLFSNVLEFNKVALKYKANDFKVFANGRLVGTDTSGTLPSGLNQLDFSYAGSSDFLGKAKSVMVFKEALTDLELEKLTGYNNHELYMNYYNRLSYLGLVEEYNVESDINNYIL